MRNFSRRMVLSPCFLHNHMVMIFWCMTRMVLTLLAYCMALDNRFTNRTAYLLIATNLFVYILKAEKDADGVYLCISDFVAPKESGVLDYVGMFAVTCGLGCRELCKQ